VNPTSGWRLCDGLSPVEIREDGWRPRKTPVVGDCKNGGGSDSREFNNGGWRVGRRQLKGMKVVLLRRSGEENGCEGGRPYEEAVDAV
jgi:hypothetical protein